MGLLDGNTFAPGLRGYMAGQQMNQQKEMQGVQLLGLLASLQGQAADRDMKQQLFPLQLQEHQAKIKKMQDDADMTAALGPLLASPNLPPELLDALGVKLAAGGHPGAATVMNIADKRRQLAENKQAIQGMQSSPGVTPVTPNDDEGNPNPVIPARPGVLDPLLNSPYVGPAAQSFQNIINQGAQGMTPQQIQGHVDRLTQLHTTAANQKTVQDAITARSKDNQQFRIDFRGMYPPQESSPYTNVQQDGKGGFVGLNKRTMRMEQIPTADGVAGAGGAGAPGQIAGPALEMAAARYLNDGTLPPNMGRGMQGTANTTAILNRAAEIAKDRGMDGEATRISQVANKGLQTALTGLERQRANVMAFEKTALAGADIALEMSSKVDRTGVPLVNKWVNAGRVALAGDPDVSRLNNAVETFTNEYAKVMSGSSGGQATTVSMQEHARKMLSGAMTKEQFSGVIDLMKREMTQTRETAFDAQINEMKARMKAPSATSVKPDAPRVRRYNPATGKIE